MSANRQAGDIVAIYEDPLTELSASGMARLVSFEGAIGEHEGREIEVWEVEYCRDPGQVFERQLLTPKAVE